MFGRRSGWSDEMLVTALTVRAATSVKSGPARSVRPAGAAAGASRRPAGAVVGGRGASPARPSHAAGEHEAHHEARADEQQGEDAGGASILADVDAARPGCRPPWDGHGEHAVAEIGGDASTSTGVGSAKRRKNAPWPRSTRWNRSQGTSALGRVPCSVSCPS